MNPFTVFYMVLTAPIYLLGAIIKLVGICIMGIGNVLLEVWHD
jgi:hypothetical protein